VEALAWLLVVAVAFCIAVAPAFPAVRRRFGLVDDTPQARAVRGFLRSPLRAIRRGAPGPAYPQQAIEGVPGAALTGLELLREAESEFSRVGDRWGEANVLNMIGFILERHGEFEEAVESHSQALGLFREVDDRVGESDSLNDLGVIYARKGEAERAMKSHRAALGIREELPDEARLSNSHNNLGVLLATEAPLKARAHFARAEALAQVAGDRRGAGKAINNDAVLEIKGSADREQLDSICKRLLRSLPYRKSGKDQRGRAKTENNLGIVSTMQGRHEAAEEHFMRATTLAGGVEDNVALLHALENWLPLAERRDDPIESPKRIANRLADQRRLLRRARVLEDREAVPIEIDGDRVDPEMKVALLSSGSTTPVNEAALRKRLRQHQMPA
jgi:tetratricopeptide (TPR) repeat protein